MPDPLTLYKAVRLDGTSHYDKATRWEVGVPVKVTDCDPPTSDGCGRGIHASRTLLGAVGFQRGPSEYLAVQRAARAHHPGDGEAARQRMPAHPRPHRRGAGCARGLPTVGSQPSRASLPGGG